MISLHVGMGQKEWRREKTGDLISLPSIYSVFARYALLPSAELGFIPFMRMVCQWNNTVDKAVPVLTKTCLGGRP
jgi:hypothetical protein